MARAAAAAMQQNYQEAIDVCSELLTSGIYEELAGGDRAEDARIFRAEARLLMATALHYADAPYEDIIRLLSFAMESPPPVQKDVYFTMAVVQLSFGHSKEARESMENSLRIIESELESDANNESLARQRDEAKQFLREL
jgi:hypothetical protein